MAWLRALKMGVGRVESTDCWKGILMVSQRGLQKAKTRA